MWREVPPLADTLRVATAITFPSLLDLYHTAKTLAALSPSIQLLVAEELYNLDTTTGASSTTTTTTNPSSSASNNDFIGTTITLADLQQSRSVLGEYRVLLSTDSMSVFFVEAQFGATHVHWSATGAAASSSPPEPVADLREHSYPRPSTIEEEENEVGPTTTDDELIAQDRLCSGNKVWDQWQALARPRTRTTATTVLPGKSSNSNDIHHHHQHADESSSLKEDPEEETDSNDGNRLDDDAADDGEVEEEEDPFLTTAAADALSSSPRPQRMNSSALLNRRVVSHRTVENGSPSQRSPSSARLSSRAPSSSSSTSSLLRQTTLFDHCPQAVLRAPTNKKRVREKEQEAGRNYHPNLPATPSKQRSTTSMPKRQSSSKAHSISQIHNKQAKKAEPQSLALASVHSSARVVCVPGSADCAPCVKREISVTISSAPLFAALQMMVDAAPATLDLSYTTVQLVLSLDCCRLHLEVPSLQRARVVTLRCCHATHDAPISLVRNSGLHDPHCGSTEIASELMEILHSASRAGVVVGGNRANMEALMLLLVADRPRKRRSRRVNQLELPTVRPLRLLRKACRMAAGAKVDVGGVDVEGAVEFYFRPGPTVSSHPETTSTSQLYLTCRVTSPSSIVLASEDRLPMRTSAKDLWNCINFEIPIRSEDHWDVEQTTSLNMSPLVMSILLDALLKGCSTTARSTTTTMNATSSSSSSNIRRRGNVNRATVSSLASMESGEDDEEEDDDDGHERPTSLKKNHHWDALHSGTTDGSGDLNHPLRWSLGLRDSALFFLCASRRRSSFSIVAVAQQ